MKICVVPAQGLGDFVIFHIASFHLQKMGHEVITITRHQLGKWVKDYQFATEILPCDAIFLQHDNTPFAEKIRKNDHVYTFLGSYRPEKHAPLKKGFDYVANPNLTMVDSVILSLKELFNIEASSDNGLRPLPGLVHRKHPKRIAIHTTSGELKRNFPEKKFKAFANWAEKEGFEPVFLPLFNQLEELASFLYESGYFIGNDSGPAHLASSLGIPNLVIGKQVKHLKIWRPGWGNGSVLTPPKWIPNLKGLRFRDKYWKTLITSKMVIKSFKNNILRTK